MPYQTVPATQVRERLTWGRRRTTGQNTGQPGTLASDWGLYRRR